MEVDYKDICLTLARYKPFEGMALDYLNLNYMGQFHPEILRDRDLGKMHSIEHIIDGIIASGKILPQHHKETRELRHWELVK